MGIKLTIYSENEVNNICLTNHIIKRYGKNLEEPDGKNEYLSGPILGIEFSGKVEVYDKSGEILELKKLAEWAKRTAHEKDIYRKTVIEWNDISGNEYDSITLEKTFVVRYEQSFDGEKGEGEFYILIRSLDHMDDVFGQAWDSVAWSIDDVTVKAENTTGIYLASNPVDTEYTILAQTAEEYQKYIDGLSSDELLNEFCTLSLVGIDVPSMLGMLDNKTKVDMIWNKINKRNSNNVSKITIWLANIEKPEKYSDDYLYEKPDDKLSMILGVKPQNVQDGFVTIGFGHIIQTKEEADKYRFETYKKQSVQTIESAIQNQLKVYGTGLNNPAILTIKEAEQLLDSDFSRYKENACIAASKYKLLATQNQIDAIASIMFNSNYNLDDPEQLIYYFVRNDKNGALQVLHMAMEKGWYGKHNGLLRRRLMEFNIFFNNDYTFYDSDEIEQLKIDIGF